MNPLTFFRNFGRRRPPAPPAATVPGRPSYDELRGLAWTETWTCTPDGWLVTPDKDSA